MYLRLNQLENGQAGINARAMAAAARRCGIVLEVGSGLALAVCDLDGKRLEDFGNELKQLDPAGYYHSIGAVRADLKRCSRLLVIDQPHELLLASDTSREIFATMLTDFAQLVEAYEQFLPLVHDFQLRLQRTTLAAAR